MLDNFRETAITWDKANRKVYEPLRVSAGDNKGRKLSIQVVNGGVVENLSGASLSLFWETRDKMHKGLDVFTAVDATKGEFEIYYTTGMLSNEGVLKANLVLVDTSGRVVSEPFTITVFKGIDDDAIQSSDSFTALTEALIDVSNLEQNYAPRLNDLTAQLQQTTAESMRKRKLEDLDSEVISAIEGGEGTNFNLLSIPQDNSVTLDKIVNPDLLTGYVASEIGEALPVEDKGDFSVELEEKGNVHISNGNISDLFGLTNGTYTSNGITVTINGNELMVTGTATANSYFKISEGSGFQSTNVGLSKPLENLPKMLNFYFSLYEKNNSGDPITVSIRSTVSGNYSNITTNSVNSFYNLDEIDKVGQIYIYIIKDQNVNAKFKLALGAGQREPKKEVTPNTLTYKDVKRLRIKNFGQILSDKSGITKELTPLTDLVVGGNYSNKMYVESTESLLYFYIKGNNTRSNKWLRYKFEHWDGDNNGKGWVLGTVDAVEKDGQSFNVLFPVVKAGEWEMAIRLKDRPDFIGCKQHGSEVSFYTKFYIDGTSWEPIVGSFWCDEIRVIEKLEMYDPFDEVTSVGTHTKVYDISVDGILLKQKVEWSKDNLTGNNDAYMAMLPIIRGNDNDTAYQITSRAYNDYDLEEIDVSAPQHDGRLAQSEPNEWVLYSDSTGISAIVRSEVRNRLAGANSFIQNSASYNKVYFNYAGAGTEIKSGDVWENEVTYRLEINS